MDKSQKEKKVYIIGHKNPDTDSIVSAAAYAALKHSQGLHHYIAARAGKPTPQTEYIFNRFKVPLPEFLPDLVPKVDYYYTPHTITVSKNVSLWEAMGLLETHELRALPVIDDNGRYHSLLHYSAFTQKVLRTISPQQKTVIQTSIELLCTVLSSQTIVAFKEKEIKKSPIIIAAAEFDSFCEHLNFHTPENSIVITGNRADIQKVAIEAKVRALIITNGNVLSKELRELAEKNKVSILISPYDTSSTAVLIVYSMPVSSTSNPNTKAVNKNDPTRKVAALLADAPGKSLPVVNDDDIVVGVIYESDLYRDANIDIVMVDHNEPSQAIEGIENYTILEIIDHHRIGNIQTKNPITFINRPVGATSTIIAGLYQEHRIPLKPEIASILLCGILADTLILQSATTTQTDRDCAEYLANITNLDIEELGRDLLTAASNITGRTPADLIKQDMKEYSEDIYTFTVSQIEVEDPHEVLNLKDELIKVLETERQRKDHLFSALMVTDITDLTSLILFAAEKNFEQSINLPKVEGSVYELRGVVSRKKQLMPILSELVERYQG